MTAKTKTKGCRPSLGASIQSLRRQTRRQSDTIIRLSAEVEKLTNENRELREANDLRARFHDTRREQIALKRIDLRDRENRDRAISDYRAQVERLNREVRDLRRELHERMRINANLMAENRGLVELADSIARSRSIWQRFAERFFDRGRNDKG